MKNAKNIQLSWSDLVRLQEKAGLTEIFRAMAAKRVNKPWPPIYDQSGSPVVDALRGIQSRGNCYTRPSFEIKLINQQKQ